MSKKEIFTIPNILSMFRLILIPIYTYIYLTAETVADYRLAALIFAISSVTDMLDGLIARKFNMISKLGKILDPIADKATQGILMICLMLKYTNMQILFIFFVIKEGFMTVMGIINYRNGKMLDGAKMSGKVCTTVLFISMTLMLLIPDMSDRYVNLLIVICAVFMLISFVSYINAYRDKHLISVNEKSAV